MFDIGFSEIVVCAIVALIVIGPERMPETVRTVGLWIGRLKRSLHETRAEIERQIGVDDIRRQLHNEDIMRSLEDARKDINSVIEQSQHTLQSARHDLEHQNEIPAQAEIEKEYKSEPDLPYHSHIHEQTTPSEQQALPAQQTVSEPTSATEQPSLTNDHKTPL